MSPYTYPAKQNFVLNSDEILTCVSHITNISIDKIKQKDKTPGARKRENVTARQTTAYLLTNFCKFTLSDAGRVINRDHASVLHGNRETENQLETNARFRDHFAKIMSYCFMTDRQKRNINLYSMKMIHNENVYIISTHPIFI